MKQTMLLKEEASLTIRSRKTLGSVGCLVRGPRSGTPAGNEKHKRCVPF